jgi:signal transduction histidine kinase
LVNSRTLPQRSDPTSDLLRHRAFPELAEALRSQIGAILDEWKERVRKVLPHRTSGLNTDQLEDSLPAILTSISEALASDDPKETRRMMERSPSQGITRFQQHYEVRDVATEDGLLRRVVVERVAQSLGRRATVEEEVALHMAIDLMLQQAVVAFVTQQNQQLRAAAETELQYLSFLSHDLRGNLGNVTLWLQALKLELAGPAQSSSAVATLDMAQQAILDTMGGMGRLLQAERLRHQGAAQPKPGPLNLHETAWAMVRQFVPQAEQKGVRVVVEVPPDAVVRSDRELITLALQNLVGNAVKYSTQGTVRVSAEQQADGRVGAWTLLVSDEGPGIAPERLATIFEAFRRGEMHGQSGVGLGLTIASRAAKLLGAELTVESELGAGSTFRLALPPEAAGAAGETLHPHRPEPR